MKIKCVLFDFDGVIIENSQILAFEILKEELLKYGLNISLDYLIENFQGMKGEAILHALQSMLFKEIPLKIIESVRAKYSKILFKKARLGNNLIKILPKFEERFICSSNYFDVINKLLSVTQIKDYFPNEVIFSLDHVKNAKPAADVYLKAIDRMSTPIGNCCAIEDSTTGVKSAKAAGLYTIGYVAGFSLEYQEKQSKALLGAGADRVINDFLHLSIHASSSTKCNSPSLT